MEENKEIYEGDIKIKTPFKEKAENFWYHYKWHSIAAVFAVVVIIILTLQMCSKEAFDAYILYAGNYEISRNSSDGDLSAYQQISSSFKTVCEDFDEDGNVNPALLNLYVLNSDEIAEALEGKDGYEINESLIREDTETLHQTLLFGEYFVCLLSERLFLEYEAEYGGALFAPIAEYTADGAEYRYASEHGIYLSSTAFGQRPEMAKLPEDTVICIRALSEVSTHFSKKEMTRQFERGEKIITNILAYGLED